MKYITIFLVLLCCFMGAASAAEDVSTDVADACDDDLVVDAVEEEISDSSSIDEIEQTVSDDASIEEIDEDIKTDEISEESATVDSEQTRATNVNAADWSALSGYCIDDEDTYTITLTGTSYNIGSQIIFGNSATIIGSSSSYITGGSSSQIPFKSTGDLSITFKNVVFKDINASILIKLATGTGTNKFINCSFDNVHTYFFKSSVIWNDQGYMNISGCIFTNCINTYGAVTNYATSGTVQMDVENCRFENNTASSEPGAINNCGELTVNNSTFINNKAKMWAGAIHTHTNAYTRIEDSIFTDNVAGSGTQGWNGGALFSYSTLEVINSVFNNNYCHVGTGGGAIFGYSMGTSVYNITVDSCNFTDNLNNYTDGYAGAIGAQNIGYLTVFNSLFVSNEADIGQAIAAVTKDEPYCMNCTNCSCPNCPNCTNCSHNVSTGYPTTKIYNNTFVNHTGTGDTVYIAGNHYLFENNTFINSTQNTVYNGIGNLYNRTTYALNYVPPVRSNSKLGSSELSEDNDVVYVDPDELFALKTAVEAVNDGGTIYVPASTYTKVAIFGSAKNFTMIGLDRENTILQPKKSFSIGATGYTDGLHYQNTFINLTFVNPGSWGNDVTFINCTFINSNFTINDEYYEIYEGTGAFPDLINSYITNFKDCQFINSSIEGNFVEARRFTQINFNNCTFENITANSLVSNTGDFTLQDAINFYDCTFTDVNVKGIVDVPTGTNPVERYRIEGCSGVESFGTVTEDGRDFVNITQSRAETVLVADIDSEGNLLINLTDKDGNGMAEADVLISVNGGEVTPYTLGSDGTLSIALGDLTDATGKLNIAVTFEENDDYKGASDSISTVLVVNTVTEVINNTIIEYVNKTLESTSIVADALTATAKVAKTLSVTLRDASGKAIANKVITYSINGVTKTATTNANGLVKITVNQAKAGTYYYALCFLGDNDYKASFKTVKVTVKKQATKAVFKAKTFKVKAKTKKVSFTIKDASGKAIKGKKITVKVNGKTYTATTNAKGVATFKVKLTKKGKYTATAKFAGDTSYKAITKKAKITLK